jgi:hypothetical protein
MHLVHREDQLSGEDLLTHQVGEFDGHVHAVVVEEADGVLLGKDLGDQKL